MKAVCLVDTSVFVELLQVPKMCQHHALLFGQFEEKVQSGEHVLLPMAAILEAGNHIAQQGDGRQRRTTAQRFVEWVGDAIDGKTPFTPTEFFEKESMRAWLEDLPDWASRGAGLGDLSIRQEYYRQCELHRHRRVYIWSLDKHLSSFDRRP